MSNSKFVPIHQSNTTDPHLIAREQLIINNYKNLTHHIPVIYRVNRAIELVNNEAHDRPIKYPALATSLSGSIITDKSAAITAKDTMLNEIYKALKYNHLSHNDAYNILIPDKVEICVIGMHKALVRYLRNIGESHRLIAAVSELEKESV